MEADWEIEIGSAAPVLDPLWDGFVDLRTNLSRISELTETHQFQPLDAALVRLNSPESQLWTAKCDVWMVDDFSQIDPDEMEATASEASTAQACYIDILPEPQRLFQTLEQAESYARNTVTILRQLPSRCARTDLIIRRAFAGEQHGFGITVYIIACGVDSTAAEEALATALPMVVNTLCITAITPAQP